jgi:hypothetical protein
MFRFLRDQTVRMLLIGFAVGTAGVTVVAPVIARADEAGASATVHPGPR